jgi:hypothetical protein
MNSSESPDAAVTSGGHIAPTIRFTRNRRASSGKDGTGCVSVPPRHTPGAHSDTRGNPHAAQHPLLAARDSRVAAGNRPSPEDAALVLPCWRGSRAPTHLARGSLTSGESIDGQPGRGAHPPLPRVYERTGWCGASSGSRARSRAARTRSCAGRARSAARVGGSSRAPIPPAPLPRRPEGGRSRSAHRPAQRGLPPYGH